MGPTKEQMIKMLAGEVGDEIISEADKFSQLLENHFEYYGIEAIKTAVEKGLYSESEITEKLKDFKFEVNKKLKLSQSTIKNFWSYVRGDFCGLKYKESIFDKNISLLDTSKAMMYGQIFEYQATGQKNYHNKIPKDKVIYKNNGDLTEVGKTIKIQVKLWKKWCRKNKVMRGKIGEKWRLETDKYIISGSPDYPCEINKIPTIIDLKFGDPDNTFGDFSWHDYKLPKAEKLLIQARHYSFMYWKKIGVQPDFIFYIAHKSDENNAQAKKIKFKDFEKEMNNYENFIIKTYNVINFLLSIGGFVLKPEVKNCFNCKVNCRLKTDIAVIKDILV